MDVKHRAWHIVGVPQTLATFIVTVIVFSKPQMARAHCTVFLQMSAWTVCLSDAGPLVLGHINLLNGCGDSTTVV